MDSALKKSVGIRIRLYTASAVESYLGVLTEVHEDYVTLQDDRHDEEMFIALPHIESFHVVRNDRTGAKKRRRR